MSQQPSTLASTNAQSWAIVVWALFLASILSVAFTALIGLIIAYVKRRDLAGTRYASHMTSAIRTFWITLIVGIIAGVGAILFYLACLIVFHFALEYTAGYQPSHPGGEAPLFIVAERPCSFQ